MSDPRSSGNKSRFGGSSGENGPGQGECASTEEVSWGGSGGDAPFCSYSEAEVLLQLKEERRAWLF